jgi:putative transposase
MSVVGHCRDNATFKGFFGVLKRERTSRMRYPTLTQSRRVCLTIERFQNPRTRRRVARRDMKFSTVFKPSMETG